MWECFCFGVQFVCVHVVEWVDTDTYTAYRHVYTPACLCLCACLVCGLSYTQGAQAWLCACVCMHACAADAIIETCAVMRVCMRAWVCVCVSQSICVFLL